MTWPSTPEDLAVVLRVVADPVRLRLLELIAGTHEISCTELVERADVAASTVSYHIKMLARAQFVTIVIDGRRRYLRCDKDRIRSVATWIESLDSTPSQQRGSTDLSLPRSHHHDNGDDALIHR